MAVTELFSRLLKAVSREASAQPGELPGALPSAQPSALPGALPGAQPGKPPPDAVREAQPVDPEDETTFGVKFASRYGWQILPPAGWQRQESGLTGSWPASGTSPSVTFKSNCEPGKQAFIRWQLSGAPEPRESHHCLKALISGFIPAAPSTLSRLSAPGLMPDMKVDKTKSIILEGGLNALFVTARYAQIKGEEPVLRYVILLPDREVRVAGEIAYFRETLQFVASQSEFSRHEKTAAASLMTFRRTESSTQQMGINSASCSLP